MLLRLLLLFTVLPLAELLLLVWIKDRTSWSFTILLVLLTGALGAALARWQGWRAIRRIEQELAQGRMPADALLDGLLILVAGVVLITPGVLTDAFGFAMLVPSCRSLVKQIVRRRFRRRFAVLSNLRGAGDTVERPGGRDQIIDVRFVDDSAGEGNRANDQQRR